MRNRFLTLLALLLVALLTAVAQTGAQAQSARDPRFGVVEALWAPPEAARLGAGWDRILFYWSEIQPEGPGDWNTLHVREEWLSEARSRNREVVGLLKNTPDWATDGIPFAGVPRGLELPVDDPGNLWASYVRKIAAFYGPRGVHRWIIWNEPDIPLTDFGAEFSGDVEDYYRLVKVASTVIKSIDPQATIHLAGLTFWHDETYLERFLEVAADDPAASANDYFFDVISLHIYFRVNTVATIVAETQATQRRFGLNKPIWINETNASPNLDPEWPVERPDFPIDLDQQAWFIVQAHALGFAAGAERISVYKLLDISLPPGGESFGLLRPDGSPRPAFDAHATAIRLLAGFEEVERSSYATYESVAFGQPDGVTRILWAPGELDVNVDVPALAGSATLVDALGNESVEAPVNGRYRLTLEGARCRGECLVGGPPLFLVEEGADFNDLPPTPTAVPPTGTPAATLPPTTTFTPSPTSPPTDTPTPSRTPRPSATPSPTPTFTPSATPTATPTPTPTPTFTPPPPTVQLVADAGLPALVTATPPPSEAPRLQSGGVTGQLSFWFLGTAVWIAALAFAFVKLRGGS